MDTDTLMGGARPPPSASESLLLVNTLKTNPAASRNATSPQTNGYTRDKSTTMANMAIKKMDAIMATNAIRATATMTDGSRLQGREMSPEELRLPVCAWAVLKGGVTTRERAETLFPDLCFASYKDILQTWTHRPDAGAELKERLGGIAVPALRSMAQNLAPAEVLSLFKGTRNFAGTKAHEALFYLSAAALFAEQEGRSPLYAPQISETGMWEVDLEVGNRSGMFTRLLKNAPVENPRAPRAGQHPPQPPAPQQPPQGAPQAGPLAGPGPAAALPPPQQGGQLAGAGLAVAVQPPPHGPQPAPPLPQALAVAGPPQPPQEPQQGPQPVYHELVQHAPQPAHHAQLQLAPQPGNLAPLQQAPQPEQHAPLPQAPQPVYHAPLQQAPQPV